MRPPGYLIKASFEVQLGTRDGTPISYAEGPGPAPVFLILADPCSELSFPHLKVFNLSELTQRCSSMHPVWISFLRWEWMGYMPSRESCLSATFMGENQHSSLSRIRGSPMRQTSLAFLFSFWNPVTTLTTIVMIGWGCSPGDRYYSLSYVGIHRRSI